MSRPVPWPSGRGAAALAASAVASRFLVFVQTRSIGAGHPQRRRRRRHEEIRRTRASCWVKTAPERFRAPRRATAEPLDGNCSGG